MLTHLYEKVLTEEVSLQVDTTTSSNSLHNNLYQLYKWSYIYGQLHDETNREYQSKLQLDKRYQNINKLIEDGIKKLVVEIKKPLMLGLKLWLDSHSLNPDTFAKGRMIYEGYPLGAHTANLLNFRLSTYGADTSVIMKNPQMVKILKHFVKGFNEKSKEFDLMNIERSVLSHSKDLVYTSIWKYVMWPLWRKTRGANVEKTLIPAENGYDLLKNIEVESIGKQIADINIIINLEHQSGDMVQYLQLAYRTKEDRRKELNVSKSYLKKLSNLPNSVTTAWENELKKRILGH